jgi:hypothetical protein
MYGTINFSMGCHSGLNVDDNFVNPPRALDFPQALAQVGGWWIGNTGFGYGMDDSIAYTERLMDLFALGLSSAPNMPVGEALRWAKNQYLGTVPSGGFGTYDEKVLVESTLYGLPMYQVIIRGLGVADLGEGSGDVGPLFSAGLLDFREVVFDDADLSYERHNVSHAGDFVGAYYSIGGEVQAGPGRPLQPRTSKPVPEEIDQTPHGAVLISGTANEETIDPVITRPVTDTALSEPIFEAPSWFPSNPWAVNRLGDEPRLVVVPALFQGNQDDGMLRRFTDLTFHVYYTDTASTDFAPPVVWSVESLAIQNEADFWVTAQDTAGIQRVVMAYTEDGIHWHSRDLDYNTLVDRWETHFSALSGQFVFFVQVVDGAGNVTVTTNKGLFFEPTRNEVNLPTVLSDY